MDNEYLVVMVLKRFCLVGMWNFNLRRIQSHRKYIYFFEVVVDLPMSEQAGPCRMILRSKDGIELYTLPSKDQEAVAPEERPFLLKGSSTLQTFAPDGSCVYVHQQSVGVSKCLLDSNDNTVVSPFLKDSKGVQMLSVSPRGTYLLTWERLSSSDASHRNLRVWSGRTGQLLHGFVQKNLKRDAWPYLQWSHDEKHAFLLVTNEIRVYPGDAFATKATGEEEVRFVDKMRCPGLTTMSVPVRATTSSYLVASFVPKTKDKPARASLHRYPTTSATPNASSYPALATKSLFQAEEVAVHWSPKGDAALMALQTSVDASGESYYGSTTLHLMHQDQQDVVAVNLPNNSTGPVLDVAWMPNPTKPPCFVVISGRMPSMASLHHGTSGEPLFLFGNAHRNTISWSSHGRFLCLAGFGNLAGGMSFWDRNKQKQIPQYDAETGVPYCPQIVASCTVGYGWSPDSRTFAVSTTSPRMNVDNGVRLYRYNGEASKTTPWDNAVYLPDRLLEASFVPALPTVYPDRAQSPAPRISGDAQAVAAAKKRAAEAATQPASSSSSSSGGASKGRYVPPSARGRTGGTSLAERMRKEKEGAMMGATKVVKKPSVPGASSGKKVPVGMSAPTGEKSKSAQRRERQKQNKAKREEEEARAKAEKEAADKAAREAAAADPEKRARKLKKTLKQIDDLKARDPSSLNDDQKKKLASEEALRVELAQLGV